MTHQKFHDPTRRRIPEDPIVLPLQGYNKFLQNEKSIPAQPREQVGLHLPQLSSQFGNVQAGKVHLGEFIRRAAGGTVLGTFSASQALNLTSTITYDSPLGTYRTFGKPIVALYQGAGTASGSQIYPIRGTGVTLGRYDVVGGEIDYANYNGTADQWRAMIIDTNGTSTQVVTFAVDWLFADYVQKGAS